MTGRLRLLSIGTLLAWGLIAGRLVHLQRHQRDKLSRHADAQQAVEEIIPARLGDIVDRHGTLLATSYQFHSLFVNPSRIVDPQALARRLAEPLGLDAGQLAERIAHNREREFLWIKRRLSESEVDALRILPLPALAWGLREEMGRAYPQGTLAAHVLGWRNIDGVPQAGVERSLDSFLQGVSGRRTLIRDAHGFVIEIVDPHTQRPKRGETVMLTLDLGVQRITEERLDRLIEQWNPRSASVIVLDPQTGEVLAMTSRPTFDPAHPSAVPPEAWTNHAVASAYEPGSTVKPCIAAWAVDRSVISSDETFACNGTFRMGPRVLHDHRAFGVLDVTGIVAHSSNIGMAQIGERLGNENLLAAVREFGFGRRTDIELPGESAGIVRPLQQWDHYSIGSVPMGQGLSTTPLQMIAAHAVLANGGRLIAPHIVMNEPGNRHEPTNVLTTRVLDRRTATWMVNGPMVDVVRRGTGRQAAIDGLTVFAKTGTAQAFDVESGSYSDDRFVGSCLCGAPAEAPRLLVLVTVDDPTSEDAPYGGTVAAPTASDILRRALRYLEPSRPSEKPLRTAAQK